MEKGVLEEILVVLAFFLSVVGCIFAEAFWLSKKGWTGFGAALGLSALTDIIGFTVGFFLLFVAVIVSLPILFDNVSNYAPPSGGSAVFIGLILSLGVLSIPLLLTICTRISLLILKVEPGKSVWLYSIVSSFLSFIFSLVIPILLGCLLYRFSF